MPHENQIIKTYKANQFKVVGLREMLLPEQMAFCDNPAPCVEYWNRFVATEPNYNPEVETFVALILNTRRRVKGHCTVATGTMDTILIHPREVFRAAIVAAAAAVVLMHCHPSGDPSPSEADIKVTRDLIRAGQLLKIDVLDHVVVGRGEKPYSSLRELGYFYA